MTDIPLISVVLPFRDAAAHLPGALDRLAALDWPRLEFLLVDDASGDGGEALAAAWCAGQAGARLITMPQPAGAAVARDAGIAAARGGYVWCADVDDDWDPGIITLLAHAAEATGAAVTCCRAVLREASGREVPMEGAAGPEPEILGPAQTAEAVLTGRIRGYQWNKLHRADVIAAAVSAAAGRDRLTSQDDFLLLLDELRARPVVTLLPDVAYRYIEHPGSVSRGDALRLDNTRVCCERAIAELGPHVPARRRRRLTAGFRVWFHLVPCIATPVHQGWPPRRARAVHERLAPQLRWSGILALARMGDVRTAAHAGLIRIAGPRGYPPAYRLLRRVLAIGGRIRRHRPSAPALPATPTAPARRDGAPR